MIARTQRVIIDFNSGASCDQAETEDGSPTYASYKFPEFLKVGLQKI